MSREHTTAPIGAFLMTILILAAIYGISHWVDGMPEGQVRDDVQVLREKVDELRARVDDLQATSKGPSFTFAFRVSEAVEEVDESLKKLEDKIPAESDSEPLEY